METSAGITKDIAILAVGIVAGLLPWLFDKAGIEMPKPAIAILGAVAVVTLWWSLSHLFWTVAPESWRSPRISLPGASFFCVATAVLIWWLSASLGWWTHQDLTKFPDKKLERISGKAYTGGTVEIDGRLFEYCTFKDVTLMYHGVGSYSLLDPTFQGSVYLKTDNKAIHDFTTMREYMSGFAVGLSAFDIDDTGKLHPLNKSDPTNLKWSDKQDTVSDKEFVNISVNVDGKRFERVTFNNVTFVYHGIGPADFVECKLLGSVNLLTDSKATVGLMSLQNFLQTVSGTSKIDISGRDASGAVVPFKVIKH